MFLFVDSLYPEKIEAVRLTRVIRAATSNALGQTHTAADTVAAFPAT
jgi:hypothetical protein